MSHHSENEAGVDRCGAGINGVRCDQPNGHAGFHMIHGQCPETTIRWAFGSEDPIQKAIAAERERCARVAGEFTHGPFLMGERLVAQYIIAKIKEGK